ncbi:hypothetical protein [uncultured Olleya sp.]|uniref:hypothetical protein n=1 Tax=uncultured Olleya sp. TaxID=757243 RepID=UPI00259345CE|nr:hypothetical protein [uncultured Olleya sp.]
MRFKIKKTILIIIALAIFVSCLVALIPFLLGVQHGYDAAIIENVVKNNCDCQVLVLKENVSNTKLIKDLKSKKKSKTFVLQLSNCKAQSLTHLKQEILSALKQENLCLDSSIKFEVLYPNGSQEGFDINNCNL